MARSFNGVSDKIATATFAIPASGGWSFFCWLNVQGGAGTIREIVRNNSGSNSPNPNIALYVNSTNKIMSVDTSGVIQTGCTFTPTIGVWCHVGFTLSTLAAIATIAYYANGATAGTDTNSAAAGGTSSPIWFGDDAFAQPMNGFLADPAIWNAKLTAAEVSALANGARPGTIRSASLAGWWPLGGLQSPEPDLSGNANNGTLTGTNPAFGPPIMQFTPRWPQFIPPPPPVAYTLMAQIVT
jgi:hypothetical protein